MWCDPAEGGGQTAGVAGSDPLPRQGRGTRKVGHTWAVGGVHTSVIGQLYIYIYILHSVLHHGLLYSKFVLGRPLPLKKL